jgi:shikimate dehydrogenase
MTRRLYFIIGDPIGQARSPDLFNARFVQSGLDAEMLPLEVAPAGFADVLAALTRIENCGGVVVTIPHKPAAAGLASIRSKRVEIAGAANVMRWTGQAWEADLFDGEGFLGGLERRGWPPAGRRAAIVGAGGAGLAIGAALLEAGAAQVSFDDVDRRQADRAVARLAAHYGDRVLRGRPGTRDDLVVNATPVGMAADDSPPIDLDALSAGVLVADVIMKPPRTRLLLEAERRGMKTQPGAPMLDEQADMIWRFFGFDSGLGPVPARPVESLLERNSAATKATS